MTVEGGETYISASSHSHPSTLRERERERGERAELYPVPWFQFKKTKEEFRKWHQDPRFNNKPEVYCFSESSYIYSLWWLMPSFWIILYIQLDYVWCHDARFFHCLFLVSSQNYESFLSDPLRPWFKSSFLLDVNMENLARDIQICFNH